MGVKRTVFFLLPILIAISLVYTPNFWTGVAVMVDFWTPWVLFESPIFDAYHKFLVKNLPVREAIPLPELTAAEATYDKVFEASDGFTFPVVIRGLMGNTSAVQQWHDHNYWIDNFGDEELLCGTLAEVVEDCTVKGFFKALENGNPFYISGASTIFEKYPHLHEMIDNEAIRAIEPGFRTASQIFMGLPLMGSDIHCAIGVNLFRQVAGQKEWYFIPPSQTAYLKPSLNVNGFSAHTQTMVGKENRDPSPWFNKLLRYTSTLQPGDVLVNPPWFWHGIINRGEPGSLVIGSPTRYGRGAGKEAAFRTNFLYTVNAFWSLYQKYGGAAFKPGFKMNLQKDIANNRRDRDNKDVREDEDDFDRIQKGEIKPVASEDPFDQE